MSPDLDPTDSNDTREMRDVESRFLLLEDYLRCMATRQIPGLYLHGAGGTGKSYRVVKFLEHHHVPYRLHNSRMTAKGLLLALRSAPSETHVLEDMERISHDRDAQGVLRSALWALPGHDRMVTWTTDEGGHRFKFEGGIVMISNRPLAHLPELLALKTRINVVHLDFSQAQLMAYMRHLAQKGWTVAGQMLLNPSEAARITDVVIAACCESGSLPDLRLQEKAYRMFLQYNADGTTLDWRDLVRASVSEAACSPQRPPDLRSSEDRKNERRRLVRDLLGIPNVLQDELVERYLSQTGYSRADFYRRKREIESGEFD